jgi:imidazolonepropionase-like amidohydrolase
MTKRTIFANAALYDGQSDRQDGVLIAVEGDRIVAVGKTVSAAAGDEQIDLAGKTVIPGMTAGHWHGDYGGLRLADVGKGYLGTHSPPSYLAAVAVENLGHALASGITNAVGAGCSFDNDACMKMAMADGRIVGPRIRAGGLHINTTANENDPNAWWLPASDRQDGLQVIGAELFADGAEGMRKAVRHQLRRGVEVIKIFPSGGHGLDVPPEQRSMATEELEMVIRTAHERGAVVRGHVCTKKLILESVKLGIDIVDHGDELDEEIIEAMVKHGTFYVPSMLFLRKLLPTGEGDLARGTQLEPVRRSFEHLCKMLPLAHKAGVKIVPGDDFGLEFMMHAPGNYAEELEVYVNDCGVAAKDVLTWATRNGGLMMGRSDLGMVREGYVADLVVVNGDPVQDMGLLRNSDNLQMIVKDGKVHKNTLSGALGRASIESKEFACV